MKRRLSILTILLFLAFVGMAEVCTENIKNIFYPTFFETNIHYFVVKQYVDAEKFRNIAIVKEVINEDIAISNQGRTNKIYKTGCSAVKQVGYDRYPNFYDNFFKFNKHQVIDILTNSLNRNVLYINSVLKYSNVLITMNKNITKSFIPKPFLLKIDVLKLILKENMLQKLTLSLFL